MQNLARDSYNITILNELDHEVTRLVRFFTETDLVFVKSVSQGRIYVQSMFDYYARILVNHLYGSKRPHTYRNYFKPKEISKEVGALDLHEFMSNFNELVGSSRQGSRLASFDNPIVSQSLIALKQYTGNVNDQMRRRYHLLKNKSAGCLEESDAIEETKRHIILFMDWILDVRMDFLISNTVSLFSLRTNKEDVVALLQSLDETPLDDYITGSQQDFFHTVQNYFEPTLGVEQLQDSPAFFEDLEELFNRGYLAKKKDEKQNIDFLELLFEIFANARDKSLRRLVLRVLYRHMTARRELLCHLEKVVVVAKPELETKVGLLHEKLVGMKQILSDPSVWEMPFVYREYQDGELSFSQRRAHKQKQTFGLDGSPARNKFKKVMGGSQTTVNNKYSLKQIFLQDTRGNIEHKIEKLKQFYRFCQEIAAFF